MKKKKQSLSENYLERIPVRPSGLKWSADEKGMVTLEIENTGFFNRLAQILFRKPRVSYIHLDEIGSFVWPLIDGEMNIVELAALVDIQFEEKARPLYERLAKYFQILESYHFVEWVSQNEK